MSEPTPVPGGGGGMGGVPSAIFTPVPAPTAVPGPVAAPGAQTGTDRAAQILAQQTEERRLTSEQIDRVLAEPLRRSETLGKLAAALAKAQGQMATATRDSKNPFFKSKYASLAAVWEACREALSANEIAVLQPVTVRGRAAIITTLLVHSSGEWIEERLVMIAREDTPQGIGSTITYGRRYGLAAMVGVAPADDDGESGSGHSPAGVRHDKASGGLQQPSGVSDELPETPEPEPPAAILPSTSTAPPPAGSVGSGGAAPVLPSMGQAPPPAGRAPVAAPVGRGGVPPPPGKPPARAPGQ